MIEKHGLEFSEDDPDVWSLVVAKGRTKRVFGIGSSDLHYVVTGKPTSSYGATPSYTEHQQSQKRSWYPFLIETIKQKEMRQEMEQRMKVQVEEERRAREEMRQEMEERMEQTIQKRLEEALRTWRPPDS